MGSQGATLAGAALASVALLVSAACSRSEAERLPPDLLLVSVDSLRADHLGAYGYGRDTSPVLDRLAAEGVRFANASAPSSWTLPSHVTLFTSLPPAAHGVLFDPKALSEDALTLAEVLHERGYATAGFVSGPFLRSLYGLAQGFDHYDDETVVRPLLESHRGRTSEPLIGLVRDWIAERTREGRTQPFFVFLHLWDVHYDYTPPPPYDRMFDPDYEGRITADNFELGDHIHAGMDPRDLEHVVALYDGEIRYTDTCLGELFEFLRERGLYDEMLVAVVADHGDEFFEHGRKGHRKDLYEETLRIPLILRYPPRIPAGGVVEELAGLADVGPTLLALAGIDVPDGFGSRTAPPGTAACNLLADRPRAALGRRATFGDLHGTWSSIRTREAKLIESRERGLVEVELYDLGADPGEREALTGRPRLRHELGARLDAWKGFWSRRPTLAVDIELDDEQRAALSALGYIR